MRKLIVIMIMLLNLSAGCATHSQKVQIDPISGSATSEADRRQYISKPAPDIDPAIDAAGTVVDVIFDLVTFHSGSF